MSLGGEEAVPVSACNPNEMSELSYLKEKIEKLKKIRQTGNLDRELKEKINYLERIYFILLTIDFQQGDVTKSELGNYILRWLKEMDRPYYNRLKMLNADTPFGQESVSTRMVKEMMYYLAKIKVLKWDKENNVFTGLRLLPPGVPIPQKDVENPRFVGPTMCRLERMTPPSVVSNGMGAFIADAIRKAPDPDLRAPPPSVFSGAKKEKEHFDKHVDELADFFDEALLLTDLNDDDEQGQKDEQEKRGEEGGGKRKNSSQLYSRSNRKKTKMGKKCLYKHKRRQTRRQTRRQMRRQTRRR